MSGYGVANARQLIIGVDSPMLLPNGQTSIPINLDNAATTPPLIPVLNEIINFAPHYGSLHRGTGSKAAYTSERYEGARRVILDFFKADYTQNTLVFVKNTTEGINKLSYRLCEPGKKNMVITTAMEHHSNDLPWRLKYDTKYVEVDNNGRLILDDLEAKLRKYQGKVKLVTVTGASNVTGYINPIHKIAELSHRYGALIHVDGAQLVPHYPLDMKPMDFPDHIDFLTFSAHKMYCPFGSGVLIGPRWVFKHGSPEYAGGGTVETVTRTKIIWAEPPQKEEAGTPNVIGAIALAAAIQVVNQLGLFDVYTHERFLADYALQRLLQLPKVKIYTESRSREPQLGIIPFNILGVPHYLTARLLAENYGIAVRNGCFCAQPYVRKLLGIPADHAGGRRNKPGMVRISFGMYNQLSEIDRLVAALAQLSVRG